MVSQNQVSSCPSCGAEKIDSEPDIPGKICCGCGLVYKDDSWVREVATETKVRSQNESQDESDANWTNDITIKDASDQQLVRILTYADSLVNRLSLTNEQQKAAVDLAVEAWNQNLMHGRDLEEVIAGVIYATCRKSGQPKPSHAVATAAEMEEVKLRSLSRMLVSELNLRNPPPASNDYLPYLTRQLELPNHLERDASKLLSNTDTIGGHPVAIAAAALYATVCDSQILTLQEAGKAAGVSKETVWRHATKFS